MLSRDEFKASDDQVAVCGVHINGDALHVGLAFKDEDEHQVIHFMSGDYIPLENLDENRFAFYLFNPIDFKADLVPSLAALAELVSQNALQPFTFNRARVVYEGGKFEPVTGGFQYQHTAERVVNCAVFTVGLLKTYDHELIAWDTWPNAPAARGNSYLNDWFDAQQVPVQEREYYYRSAKEIRGKHVIVSPDAATQPAPYGEVVLLSDQLIAQFIPPPAPANP